MKQTLLDFSFSFFFKEKERAENSAGEENEKDAVSVEDDGWMAEDVLLDAQCQFCQFEKV